MTKQYIAQLEDGTVIKSRRYGEGWSKDEAWGDFCCIVWSRARAAGSQTVIMGDLYGTCLKRSVPNPPAGMTSWTLLNATTLPGAYRVPS